MSEPLAMERVALQMLKKTVDLVLSGAGDAESDFFLAYPYFSPKPLNSQTPQLTYEPLEFEVDSAEANPVVSNWVASDYPPEDRNYESIIQEAAQRYRVDAGLIRAVIQAESGGNPLAVSRAGARGLMQLMPQTAVELGVTNSFDPAQNIMGGTSYLRSLLDRYRGDVKLALAAYNWGMGNLEKRPGSMPQETKNYVAKVERQYRNLSKT